MAHNDLNAENFLFSQGGDDLGARQAPEPRFLKTKMCKFHAVGMCTKGHECHFAHGDRDLRPLPDFYKTRLCKMWMKTGHCKQPNCAFAHNKEEIRHTDVDNNYRKESGGKGSRSRSGQAMPDAKGGLPNGMGYYQPPPPPPYPSGPSGGPQGPFRGDFGGPQGGPCGGFDNTGSPGLQQDLMMLLQSPEIKKLAESILGPSAQGMPASSSVPFADGRGLQQAPRGMFDNFGQMGQGQDSFGRRFPDAIPNPPMSAHGAVPMRMSGVNMYGEPLGPFPTDYAPHFPNPNSLPQTNLVPNQFGELDDLLAALIRFPSNSRPSTDTSAA